MVYRAWHATSGNHFKTLTPMSKKAKLGNPAAIAVASSALDKHAARKAEAKKNRTKDEADFDLEKKKQNRKIILGTVGAVAAFIIGRTVVRKIRRAKITNSLDTSTKDGLATSYAQRFFGVIVPSGHQWLNDTLGDGTDTVALYQLAEDMGKNGITVGDVVPKYRALYSSRNFLGKEEPRDLIADLQEIDPDELSTFYSRLEQASATSGGLTQYGYIKTGKRATLQRNVDDLPIIGEYGVGDLTELDGGQFIGVYTGVRTNEFSQFRTTLGGSVKTDYLVYVRTENVDIRTVYDSDFGKTQNQINDIINNY